MQHISFHKMLFNSLTIKSASWEPWLPFNSVLFVMFFIFIYSFLYFSLGSIAVWDVYASHNCLFMIFFLMPYTVMYMIWQGYLYIFTIQRVVTLSWQWGFTVKSWSTITASLNQKDTEKLENGPVLIKYDYAWYILYIIHYKWTSRKLYNTTKIRVMTLLVDMNVYICTGLYPLSICRTNIFYSILRLSILKKCISLYV